MVRKINAKRILQFRAEGLSGRAIASTQGVSRNIVAEVINAADSAARSWDELQGLTEEKVYQRLFPGRSEYESVFTQPDWPNVHRELAKVGTNLKLPEQRSWATTDSAKLPTLRLGTWRHLMSGT